MNPNQGKPILLLGFVPEKNFNIILCGGEDPHPLSVVSNVHSINGNNLKNVKSLPQMKEGRLFPKVVLYKRRNLRVRWYRRLCQ